MPAVGALVRVPIGNRTVSGCVVESPARSVTPDDQRGVRLQPDGRGVRLQPDGRGVRLQPDIRDILEVLDAEPFLPPAVVELCAWVAEYYLAGIGDAIAVALPPGARARASSFRTRRVATITAHGLEWGQSSTPTPTLTPKQQQALEILAGATAGLPLGELRDRGVTTDVLNRLAAKGLVTLRSEAEDRDPFERAAMRGQTPGLTPDPVRVLTDEQRTAFDQLVALTDAGEFRTALLHGVTGSGKTEIYLRLAQHVSRRGRQMLLMVPEI